MASAVRIVSCAAAGPSDTTTTSPVPACSLRRSASSTANSSYGLRMNLTPASSSDLPSEAILTRVSESGTRFTHTAIFMSPHVVRRYDATLYEKAQEKKPRHVPPRNLLTTYRRSVVQRPSKIRTHTQLHVPRQPGREKPLHRRPRRERILRERPEARVPPIEEVAHHAAQLEPLPLHQERRIGRRVVREAARRVRFVAPEPLATHVARVETDPQRQPRGVGRDHGHRDPRVGTAVGHERQHIAREYGLAGRVTRCREPRRAAERRGGIPIVRVQAHLPRLPLRGPLSPPASRLTSVLGIAH